LSRAKSGVGGSSEGCPRTKKLIEFVLRRLDPEEAIKVRNHLGPLGDVTGGVSEGDGSLRGCSNCTLEVEALRLAFEEISGNLISIPK
jgi:hypothetical protein